MVGRSAGQVNEVLRSAPIEPRDDRKILRATYSRIGPARSPLRNLRRNYLLLAQTRSERGLPTRTLVIVPLQCRVANDTVFLAYCVHAIPQLRTGPSCASYFWNRDAVPVPHSQWSILRNTRPSHAVTSHAILIPRAPLHRACWPVVVQN